MEKVRPEFEWLRHQVVVSESRYAEAIYCEVNTLRLLGWGETPEAAQEMARRSPYYPKDVPTLKTPTTIISND